jgi:adenine-specific DNA methylase
MHSYPKRLIEVDLPIKQISAHARREKSIRHGHISTLHIWWARRPLAACRAVICAALWPDPADPLCPPEFREDACRLINAFAAKAATDKTLAEHCSHDIWKKWQALAKSDGGLDPCREAHWNVLRFALLDFIADFANWDNSSVSEYLDTSRALTQAAHEALGGELGTRPLVVDPFAGGGSIPLEALRVGADTFASDLNPVAVLLNKVILEYIPKHGQRLADEVRKWGEWIKREAEKELDAFYPKDADGATPIAYLWARTIQCEGPGCGAEVPLMRSLWLAKKASRSAGMQIVPNPLAKRVDFRIIIKQRDGWVDQANPKAKIEGPTFDGIVKRGSATCPCCGYTTPVARVREQLKTRSGGARDARLFCVVTTHSSEQGRFYRLPTDKDLCAAKSAAAELERRRKEHVGALSLVPDEKLDLRGIRHTWAMIYGIDTWGDMFLPRQALVLTTLFRLLGDACQKRHDDELSIPTQVVLALAIDRQANSLTSLSRWNTAGEKIEGIFARQAIPLLWDFAEVNPFSGSTGDFDGAIEWVLKVCEANAFLIGNEGHAVAASATRHPLADDSVEAFVTDPPYYDAVPYAFLSDFFYVWLRRGLANLNFDFFRNDAVPKDEEIVVDRTHELSNSTHDIEFYERELTKAFAEGRRVLRSDGVGTIVFASKTTASWEAILKAVVDSGWIITGSWPIDTEMESRIAAAGQARLASSVHLVCRPREIANSSDRVAHVGDWRDVLQELPRRIHDWMPRLAAEGVVGADAIFACLGPALEIFSRYSRVEKASGDMVPLKEYLEQVWAAVAKEALAMIFTGADTSAFEEDARLTAMWLWTLNAGKTDATNGEIADEEESDDDSEGGVKKAKAAGFVLEYDAARKIAQGLGAHLEDLGSLVEVSGEQARLLPVGERARHLFGKDEGNVTAPKKKNKIPQLDLFKVLEEVDGEETISGEAIIERHGKTVLDRIHQSMILFAAGRSEALKRFLVEEGVGRDQRFWSLAQALSALYPTQTSEKRWIDGVLARKKGLGF